MKRKNPLIAYLGTCLPGGLLRLPIADLTSKPIKGRTWLLSLLLVMLLWGPNLKAQGLDQVLLGDDPPVEFTQLTPGMAMEMAILISDSIESGVRKIRLFMNPCLTGSLCRFRLEFKNAFPSGVQITTRTSAGVVSWITTPADSRVKHGQIDFVLAGNEEGVLELITITVDPLFTGYDNQNELLLFDGGTEVLVELLDQYFAYDMEAVGKHVPSPTPPVEQPNEQLRLSPNPTSGHCDVSFSGYRNAAIVVRNLLGQVVLQRDIPLGSTVRLDLQGLSPGSYTVYEQDQPGKAIHLVIQ
jgi:hypothetical protein